MSQGLVSIGCGGTRDVFLSFKTQCLKDELLQCTSEGTCSQPNILTGEFIQWYDHLLGSKPVANLEGWFFLAADCWSSTLWLDWPQHRDAAVYYCNTVGDHVKCLAEV
uniref:Uncharacterized protein n=1 Tax=Anser brachyrhynchus TaxID=132585 RepID=A0A8B9B8C4_9AVES